MGITVSTLHIRKLKLRRLRILAQDHHVSKLENWNSNWFYLMAITSNGEITHKWRGGNVSLWFWGLWVAPFFNTSASTKAPLSTSHAQESKNIRMRRTPLSFDPLRGSKSPLRIRELVQSFAPEKHKYILLLIVVVFYKVPKETELVNTEPLCQGKIQG